MEKQVIFKSALNGFEKSSVLKYIDELNHKLDQVQQNHQEKLDAWENEKEELCDQIAALDVLSKELQKKLDAETEKAQSDLQEKEALIADLKAEIKALSQKNEEQDHELIMQREQNRLLREEAEKIEAKGKKYDEAAASIGDVILAARQDAAHIVEEAKAKAESIISDAKAQAEQLENEAQDKLSVTQNKMDQLKAQFFSIREQMNSSVALLNDQFGQVEASMQPAGEATVETAAPAEEASEEKAEETVSENKSEHPLKAILEQAAASANHKNNFFR